MAAERPGQVARVTTRKVRAASGISGALYSSLTPIFALLVLQPAEYGLFSIVYLLSAFGISLQYSIVSEAWARSTRLGASASWTGYSGALTFLSLAVAIVAAIASLLVSSLMPLTALFTGAVFFTIFRNGSRYFAMANDSARSVVLSDSIGVVAFVGAFFASQALGGMSQIAIAWLAAGLAGMLALRMPRLRWGAGLLAWFRGHGRQIRPLLADSLLMDAGAIGTPFLLAGFMGSLNFGIYRAVSNAALPVRLLVDPMRPTLGRMSPHQILSRKMLAFLAASALVLSFACFAILEWVLPAIDIDFGTLSSLTPYAAAAAVFVIGSLLGTVFYIACRTNSSPRQIIIGRVTQTALVISLPILGFIWWQLTGAIWGFSISSVVSAAVWGLLLVRSRSRTNAVAAREVPSMPNLE